MSGALLGVFLENSAISPRSFENAIKTQGAAHAQFITSTSVVVGSATAWIPCQKTKLVFTGDIGAEAKMFGVSLLNPSKSFTFKDENAVVPLVKACTT